MAGVDGSGYIFVHGLMQSGHAPAYVARAAHYMAEYGIDVVDVGVASNKFPAVTTAEVARYKQLADAQNRTAVRAFLNACGSTYGEPVNGWLDDGTPVINSVCQGPPATDDTDGHFIYYYRDHLKRSDEALDLADKIRWVVGRYAKPEGFGVLAGL